MAIRYARPDSADEVADRFDCDDLVVTALVTVGAFVALADGGIEAIERDETVNYLVRRRLAPSISRQRIAEFFDARTRELEGRDFGGLIVEALRPVAALSLGFDVVRIAEAVAAADRHVDASEVQAIRLIRLVSMNSPAPKPVNSFAAWSRN